MKTKNQKKEETKVETTEAVPVPTPQPAIPVKPDWGNPFHNQQRFSNKAIGGKRGFSGASRKGGMGGGK
jgi:hypothetical protein